jgi:hypothetical protein
MTTVIEPGPVASRNNTGPQANVVVRQLRSDLRGRFEALAAMIDTKSADAGFRQLLSGMARLWRYSLFNQAFVSSQRRDATSVAGRKQWRERGRTVREGEVAIAVLAPRRSRNGGWPFVLVEVFDIAQTDGPPVPSRDDVNPTPGECPDLGRIEAAGALLGIEVGIYEPWRHTDMYGGVPNVAGRALGGRVEINPRLSPLGRASCCRPRQLGNKDHVSLTHADHCGVTNDPRA